MNSRLRHMLTTFWEAGLMLEKLMEPPRFSYWPLPLGAIKHLGRRAGLLP